MLELLLVLVILVIAYNLASPLIATWARRPREFGPDRNGGLKRARNVAISARKERLTFNLEERT